MEGDVMDMIIDKSSRATSIPGGGYPPNLRMIAHSGADHNWTIVAHREQHIAVLVPSYVDLINGGALQETEVPAKFEIFKIVDVEDCDSCWKYNVRRVLYFNQEASACGEMNFHKKRGW